MKKWHIEISATVTRVYEVEANSDHEARKIFRETDEPKLIMEEEATSEITDVSAAE